MFAQFDAAFPKTLELICEGLDLKNALKKLPFQPHLDAGAFMRWMKKRPELYAMYKEAREIRTEVWAGEMIRHATGEEDEDGNAYTHDTARSKLIVDTYWKLMAANNRKEYGDTKTIEVNQSISITSALEQAQGRIIEATIIEDDDDGDDDEPDYASKQSVSDSEDNE